MTPLMLLLQAAPDENFGLRMMLNFALIIPIFYLCVCVTLLLPTSTTLLPPSTLLLLSTTTTTSLPLQLNTTIQADYSPLSLHQLNSTCVLYS